MERPDDRIAELIEFLEAKIGKQLLSKVANEVVRKEKLGTKEGVEEYIEHNFKSNNNEYDDGECR